MPSKFWVKVTSDGRCPNSGRCTTYWGWVTRFDETNNLVNFSADMPTHKCFTFSAEEIVKILNAIEDGDPDDPDRVLKVEMIRYEEQDDGLQDEEGSTVATNPDPPTIGG